MAFRELPYSGSKGFYPTFLCIWKPIVWNLLCEPLAPKYHRASYWDHFFPDYHQRYWTQVIAWNSYVEYTLTIHTSNVSKLLNIELAKIYELLTVNRLFWSDRNRYMTFHPIQNDVSSLIPSVIINGIQIEKVHNYKFLGACLGRNLKCGGHIKFFATKLGKLSGIFNKLKRHTPIDILRILECIIVNSIWTLLYWFGVLLVRALERCEANHSHHYGDVIMGTIVSQITSLTIVYSTVYSGADQK